MSRASLKPIVSKLREAIIKGVAGKLEKYGFDEKGALAIEKPLSEYDETIRDNLIALFEAKQINSQEKYVDYIHNTSRTFMHILICFKLMEKRGIMGPLLERVIETDIYNEIIPDFSNVNPMAFDEFVSKYENEIMALKSQDNNEEDDEYYQFIYLMKVLTREMAQEVPLLFGEYEYNLIQLDYDDLRQILSAISSIDNGEYRENDFLGWIYQYWVDVFEKEVKEAKKEREISCSNLVFYKVLNGLEEEQSSYGEYYTPRWVVKYIIDSSFQLYDKNGKKDIEEIKLLDPACGAGNFLVYAFDAFYEKYEKLHPDWQAEKIVRSILANNIFGADIQREPLQVTAINLWIKAKEKSIDTDISKLNLAKVNILCTNSLYTWEKDEEYRQIMLFDTPETLNQLKYTSEDIGKILLAKDNEEKNTAISFFRNKYDLIVMNPPYLGLRRMKKDVAAFLKEYYPGNYNNLFEAFIIRADQLLQNNGICGFVGSDTYLTLDSFECLRQKMLDDFRLKTLVKLGINVFDGPTVRAAILIMQKNKANKSNWIQCIEANEKKPESFIEEPVQIVNVKQEDFRLISGLPFIYEFTDHIRDIFNSSTPLGNVVEIKQGMITGDNKKHLRYKWEVPEDMIGKRFFPYAKGGGNEKWSNNIINYIDWENDGKRIKDEARIKYGSETRTVKNQQYFFREGLTYSDVGSDAGGEDFSIRYLPAGCIFDVKGSCIFSNSINMYWLLALMNSKFVNFILSQLNPTPSFQVCDLIRIPYKKGNVIQQEKLIELAKKSCDIKSYILGYDYLSDFYHNVEIEEGFIKGATTIHDAYEKYRQEVLELELKLKNIKTEIDGIVFDMYELTKEERNLICEKINGINTSAVVSIERATLSWLRYILKELMIKNIGKLYIDKEITNLVQQYLDERFDKTRGYVIFEEMTTILGANLTDIAISGVRIDGRREPLAGTDTKSVFEPILCSMKLGGKAKDASYIYWNNQQFLIEFEEEKQYAMQNEIRRLTNEVYLPKLQRAKEKLQAENSSSIDQKNLEKEVALYEECVKTLENWRVVY